MIMIVNLKYQVCDMRKTTILMRIMRIDTARADSEERMTEEGRANTAS